MIIFLILMLKVPVVPVIFLILLSNFDDTPVTLPVVPVGASLKGTWSMSLRDEYPATDSVPFFL